jgi:hypothetical protein
MNKFLEPTDSLILKLFTNISHKFQRLTGKTNFFLAKIATVIVGSAIFMDLINYWLHVFEPPPSLISVIINGGMLVWMFLLMSVCDIAEQNALSSERTKTDFGSLTREPWFRLLLAFNVFMIMIMLPRFYPVLTKTQFIAMLIRSLGYIAMVSFCYLINVDPLPPSKSKIKEWIESFAAGFAKRIPIRAEKD